MKFSSLLFALVTTGLPLLARADANPDYERDAKPILETQPGLVQYIHAHFVVHETGIARVPGSGDQAPQPPYIFSARPRGQAGPFYLRLLIQPGSEGHVLKVADVRRLAPGTPQPAPVQPSTETASAPTLAPAAEPSAAPQNIGAPEAAAPSSSSQPGADTPSGPIHD